MAIVRVPTPSAAPASASATVATSQTTNSGNFTDLATAGPSVTLTTGTKVLVITSCQIENQATNNQEGYVDFAISGATTRSASTATGIFLKANSSAPRIRASAANIVTVTAGSNTFTMKYAADTVNNATFLNRHLLVIDLGS
jgi:hypothetical protein